MALYRILLVMAAPAVAAWLVWLRLCGRDTPAMTAQRLGGGAPRAAGAAAVVWVHGASNGELASARAMLAALLDRHPGLGLVVTANTATGLALVNGWSREPWAGGAWAAGRLAICAAPIDYRWALGRFLRRHRPVALLTLENELWPNRMDMCRGRGMAVVALGARMSARAARRWGRVPGLARRTLGAVSALSAQDDASAARLAALAGIPGPKLLPVANLKSRVAATAAAATHRPRTVLAASTHPGEEALVLEAFAPLWRADRSWRLILAPRHPRRAAEIAALIARQGLPMAQRGAGAGLDAAGAVYLADTMGEMALWYALAPVTFVGGSLVDLGGHTPYEPTAMGSAVVHGPWLSNFADAYERLASAGAARPVETAADLRAAMAMAADLPAAADLARRARAALDADRPDDDAALADAVAAALNLR